MRVREALRGVTSLFLDSAPAIYYLETNSRYGPIMDSFFQMRSELGILLSTSPITLAECLVHPVREGNAQLIQDYRDLITSGEGTTLHAIGADEASEAARIRALHNLRLADSIQAAVAMAAGCEVLLTNDPIFRRLTHPRAILLDDLEP